MSAIHEAGPIEHVEADIRNTPNDQRGPSMGPPVEPPPPKTFPASYNGYKSSSGSFHPYNNDFSETGTYSAMNEHTLYRENGSAAFGGTSTSIRVAAKVKTIIGLVIAMNVVVITVAIVAIWFFFSREISSEDLLVPVQQLKASNPEIGFGVPGLQGPQGPQGPQGIQGEQGIKGESGVDGVISQIFDSGDFAVGTPGSTTQIIHGLGVKPKLAQVFMVCTTAEFGHSVGHSVGDVHPVIPVYDFGGDWFGVLVQSMDDVNSISVTFGHSGLRTINPTNGHTSIITSSSWKFGCAYMRRNSTWIACFWSRNTQLKIHIYVL